MFFFYYDIFYNTFYVIDCHPKFICDLGLSPTDYIKLINKTP